MNIYLQKAAFLALVALSMGCSKEDSDENTPVASDVLLSVEVDQAFYEENTEEWFYLSTPEGELLAVPMLAENGKTNQILRPEGFLGKDFQLNILKASVDSYSEEFVSYVYTHFDAEKVFRRKTNSQKAYPTRFNLHILRNEYLPNEDFFISTSKNGRFMIKA